MRYHSTPTHPSAAKIIADDAVHKYLEKHFSYVGQQMTEPVIQRAEAVFSQQNKTKLITYNILKYYRYDTNDKDFFDAVHQEVQDQFNQICRYNREEPIIERELQLV